MKRIILSIMLASLASVLNLQAQGAAGPRRILFDTFEPIAARIVPGDQRIVVVSAKPSPQVAYPKEGELVPTLVRENPIIFTGRVVQKQPVFLRLRAGQNSTEVSVAEANWIGSRVTILVDRIIQTVEELPLAILQRLTFVEDGDGGAIINSVRIDTETPWLEPVQEGRRYLISGQVKAGAFSSTGMWMEDGATLRPRFRGSPAVSALGETAAGRKAAFTDWTIDEASDQLQNEVERRALARP